MSNICGRYLISDANVMLELVVDMGFSYGSEVVYCNFARAGWIMDNYCARSCQDRKNLS